MYDLLHRSAGQDAALDAVISAAQRAGPRGVVALDLDGCLFDNRPRQVQILRVWAARNDEMRLAALEVHHLEDWSLTGSFERLGMSTDEARELSQRVQPAWAEGFFGQDYIDQDRALPGAPRFVRQLQATGVHVVYLTGRTVSQADATLRQLRRHGFPVDEAGECLLAKPDGPETDEQWKQRAFEALAGAWQVVGFLDNEPVHVRHAAGRFPEAAVVWVMTDHSPRPVTVPSGQLRIHGFLRTTDPQLR